MIGLYAKPRRNVRHPVTFRLAPDEDAALRAAASHLRCPIGHLVRHMLGPVFDAYSVASGANLPPHAPIWPQPVALPAPGVLAYDPREHQRRRHFEQVQARVASPVPAPAVPNARDAGGRNSTSFRDRKRLFCE
jgi:hypothetical protein